jgi:hypothetical protein
MHTRPNVFVAAVYLVVAGTMQLWVGLVSLTGIRTPPD